MNFIKKIYYRFFGPCYRYPTNQEIQNVDFKYQQTLKDLHLYDQGELEDLDNTARLGSLREYCQKRGHLQS
jgi:hypothetical protein